MKPASARRGRSHGSGAAGFATACGAADGIQLALRAGGRLAATGAMSAVIMPTLNTEVVNLFLEQFAARVARRGACGADLGRGGLPHR